MKRWLIVLLLALGAVATQAREATPMAADELVEKRMVAISDELRCLVCQNESLSGSHAELANDLRREIRTLIKDGKSDNEILDFMVARYGDFVRYRPPVKGTTLLLWFGPAALLLIGLVGLIRHLRRRNDKISDAPLNSEEQSQADALLQTKDAQQ